MEYLGCDERGPKEVTETPTGFKPIEPSDTNPALQLLSYRETHAERGHLRDSLLTPVTHSARLAKLKGTCVEINKNDRWQLKFGNSTLTMKSSACHFCN